LKLSPFLNPGRPTTSRVFCSDDHSATNNFKPADFLHVHAAVHTLSYAEAAARLNLTELATRKAVQRLRQSYRALLRQEVAQTVAAPHEVEAELKYLIGVFAA
ncbi:MAG TPA: hypothetical protein VFE51_08505, partial [Verrucomicrobiae bacterium]|nr:hypothetical protein [Verrucomicrobiae bacterium]